MLNLIFVIFDTLKMIDNTIIYIYSEQPTNCPKCGCRTEIIADFSHTITQRQIHKCDFNCKYAFVIEHDIDFEN